MARSYRHTPIIGHCTAPSEKEDKRLDNRARRRKVRARLRTEPHSDIIETWARDGAWRFDKDGKGWIADWADVKRRMRK